MLYLNGFFMKTSYWRIFLCGIGIGAADLIPGVSGGTVAFITGIYQRLLNAISMFSSPSFIISVFRQNIRHSWQVADGSFLLSLLAGMITAVVLLAKLLRYLLSEHTHLLLAFFCGLVIASAWGIAKQFRVFVSLHIIIGFAGAAVALIIVTVPSVEVMPTLPIVAAAGAIAICAMILPGISGSYILLIIGLYAHIIEALHNRDGLTLLVFVGGCVFGLLTVSRLIAYAYRRWHDSLLALLIGFMLGAMPKLWPWKEKSAGVKTILQPNIMPTLEHGQILAALGCAIVGVIVVWGLQKFARRYPS